jgi:hypothetical protein
MPMVMKKQRERGREAPMVISPLRVARLLAEVAHKLKAGRRERSMG